MEKTVLIVEDEVDILELIEYTLVKDNFEVIGCVNTSSVKQILDEEDIDLILMDRNLPGIEGSVYINSLRQMGYEQPVIYLTAKDSADDIIEGFKRGGDDYITKPFNLEELKVRINAVLKRTSNKVDLLKYKDIEYNRKNKKFKIEMQEIALTHLEHDLLLEFLKNKDILLSREYLLENVWEDSLEKKSKTVNVAIKRLKEKIDPDGKKEYIKSVRGEGYIFC